MKLPKAAHEHLRKEFAIAAKFMQNTSDQSGVLYYFSAFLGATHRAMNLSYSTDLALMHLVLKTTHDEITDRIREIRTGQERVVLFQPSVFSTLKSLASRLATLVETPTIDDKALYDIYAQLAELAYVSTGNGYYLLVKGSINLDDA